MSLSCLNIFTKESRAYIPFWNLKSEQRLLALHTAQKTHFLKRYYDIYT